jgi:hypothetical protein
MIKPCHIYKSAVYAAFGYHGNGIAMGSWSRQRMAKLALSQRIELPGFLGKSPRRFELDPFRRLGLYGVYFHSFLDGAKI